MKTILISEDNDVNRKILVKILAKDYRILEAADGNEALELLHRHKMEIDGVILDLMMPVMDGFSFLKAIQGVEEYANIPIIVATGNDSSEHETRALELGAWDFVSKPYNPKILQFRLRNAIERSRLSLFNQLKYQAEYDMLTGIYNKNMFFRETRKLLDAEPERHYAFLRFDIDRFQLLNAYFGFDRGDEILRQIAQTLHKVLDGRKTNTYGRIEADVFACCTAYEDEADLRAVIRAIKTEIRNYTSVFDIVTIFGVYILDDLSLPVSEMLDRATLAAKTCKGKYLETVARYHPEMSRRLQEEQEIINVMNEALESGQFFIHLQPKYNLQMNRPCGAEALVRWNHPERGLISPRVFIPVFEKNGFIARLDYFVWEQTCRLLKKWADAGMNLMPVSVNVSRVNLYNPKLVEILMNLVHKYEIQTYLLQLELTESAYMDNPGLMKQVVRHLQEKGFTILMDDFGSGYSSLNTLKDIDVDILKIDMKFLPAGENNCRSEKILVSIIRMAGWLGMPVVVEGVETREQKEFLKSVGCGYVQGYYFSPPIPVDQYERMLSQTGVPPIAAAETKNLKDLDMIWSSDPKIGTLLKSISIPVGIYEYSGGEYERLWANQAFTDTFGCFDAHKRAEQCLAYDELLKIRTTFEEAMAARAAAECECFFVLNSGETRWYRLKLQYIQTIHTSHIFCSVFTEITESKNLELEVSKIRDILC